MDGKTKRSDNFNRINSIYDLVWAIISDGRNSKVDTGYIEKRNQTKVKKDERIKSLFFSCMFIFYAFGVVGFPMFYTYVKFFHPDTLQNVFTSLSGVWVL